MRNFNFHLLVKLIAGIWLKNRQTCFQKMSTQALFCDIDVLRVQSYTTLENLSLRFILLRCSSLLKVKMNLIPLWVKFKVDFLNKILALL